MESKSEISRPELIAYSAGLVIVPFENVKLVYGDVIDGRNKITVVMDDKNVSVTFIDDEAQKFLDQYNNYLAFVEAATITDLTGGKDGVD